MKAIEAALRHFKDLGTQSIEIPEWGTEEGPLTVYWTPLTLEERDSFFNKGPVTLITNVDILQKKALDKDGKPMFSIEDKAKLKKFVEPTVITRIVDKMLSKPTIEDTEKN